MKASPLTLLLLGLALALVAGFLFFFMGDEETDVVGPATTSDSVEADRTEAVRRHRGADADHSTESAISEDGEESSEGAPDPERAERDLHPAISGRVLKKEDGRPIMGAKVGLLRSSVVESFMSLDLAELFRTTQAPNHPITVATTDDEGVFHIQQAEPGDYTVLVRAEGFGRRFSDSFRLSQGGEVTGLEVRLEPAVTFKGIVHNPEGLPVPSVQVSLFDRGRAQLRVLRTYQTTTNEKGRFEFTDLGPGRYTGSLVAKGYGATGMGQFRLTAGEAQGEPKVYVLAPEAEVFGRVFDVSTGKGLEGALVYAMAEFKDSRGFPAYVETRSGKDGAYSLRGLPREGDLILGARSEGYGLKIENPTDKRGIPGIQLAEKDRNGERDLVDLPMVGGATVSGRILAEGSLTPIAGAEVTVISPNSIGTVLRTGPVTSDENGRYEIKGVPAGSFMVMASHPDFVRAVFGLKGGFFGGLMATRKTKEGRDRPLEPGEVRDAVDVVMQRGRRILGRVVDGTGAPVAGATIEFLSGDGRDAMARSVLGRGTPFTTDAEGRFELVSVPRHKKVEVVATHPRFVSSGREILDLSGDEAPPEVTLRLGEGAVFKGVAYDSDGTAMAKTLVELVPTDRRGGGFLGLGGSVRPVRKLEARTDDAGRFRIERIPAGKYSVIAVSKRVMTIELAAGEERTEELRLVREVIIEGMTLHEDGSPFSHVRVRARVVPGSGAVESDRPRNGGGVAYSDAEGHFEIAVSDGARYTLEARATQTDIDEDGQKRSIRWTTPKPPQVVAAGEKGVRVVLVRK